MGGVDKSLEQLEVTKASQQDLATLKSRVDNLVANPGEATEGNAELLDIRVGADGRTYPTAGNAVRSIAIGEGLSDDSIKLPHIDFLTSDNLAFGRLIKKFKLSGSKVHNPDAPINYIDPSQKFYAIMLVLKPDTDYTFFNATNLEKESDYYWTKILLTDLSPAEILDLSEPYELDFYTSVATQDYADHINFSTQEDNLTCIIQISQDIYPDYIELREGTFTTRKYSNYLESITPIGPVYTKDQVYNKAETYNQSEVLELLQNLIIDRDHADFIIRDNNLNLLNLSNKLEGVRMSGSNPISLQASADTDTYIIPVESNTQYSVILKATDLYYNDATYFKLLMSPNLYTVEDVGVVVSNDDRSNYIQPSGVLNLTFTTLADTNYIYLNLFTKNLADPLAQVVKGSQSALTIESFNDIYRLASEFHLVTDDQVYNKAEVDELLLGKSHLSKSGDYIYLTMNSKVSYTLRHRVDDSIKVDTWLIQSGSVAGNLLWQGTDIEAPIKEVGAADFVGGIHGDETMQDVIILADGVILDLDQDYELDFNKLTVFVTSTLYHCNTTNPAFTRYKKLEFEGGELIVSNRMICLSDFSVNRYTGCGLYSVYKDQLSGYSTNLENILKTDSGTNNSPELTKVTFYGGGFTIDIETLSGKGEHFSGSVADFSTEARPRFKAYLDCINSSGVQLQANDELNASFRINIV